MTLPQECDDVTRGVAIPKIREEGEKKKRPEKVSFLESQARCGTEEGLQVRAPVLRGARLAVWSPPFQTMSGPTWLPPKQPEPARAPQGRALPRGASGPPPAHGAGKAAPVRPRGRPQATSALSSALWRPRPAEPAPAAPSPRSPPCPRPHSRTPGAGRGAKRDPRQWPPQASSPCPSSSPPWLSLPSPQRSSPTPGSIFAPSHLSSVTRPPGDRRTGGWPGWGATEHPSTHR